MWGLDQFVADVQRAEEVARMVAVAAEHDPASWSRLADRSARLSALLAAQLDQLIAAEAQQGIGDIEVSLHETED